MNDEEILDNYMLTDGEQLTNLGILWLGDSKQRNRLVYPITVQYVVYNAQEQKIRKVDWHDNTILNYIESRTSSALFFRKSELPNSFSKKI